MKSSIFGEKYLFHFHTDFTDGKVSIPEYFQFAVESGISRLIFLEHIRRVPSYFVDVFVDQIDRCSKMYGLSYSLGFEAKLLANGNLDISEENIEMADVIGMAEHGSLLNLSQTKKALYQAIEEYSHLTQTKEVVWVHPGLFLKKHNLLSDEADWYSEALQYAIKKGLRIEYNLKYRLISMEARANLCQDVVVVGSDAHTFADLTNWLNLLQA